MTSSCARSANSSPHTAPITHRKRSHPRSTTSCSGQRAAPSTRSRRSCATQTTNLKAFSSPTSR
eukprot:787076-Rhodomonas_salina.1